MTQESKKIGTYLVENRSVAQKAVDEALKTQKDLQHAGEYKSTGQIMLESGQLSLDDLDKGLRHQWIDILSSSSGDAVLGVCL